MTDPTDAAVRLAIYRHFAEHGTAPARSALAETLSLAPADLAVSLDRLDASHAIVLDPATRELWMAMPFSAVPTDYRVDWGAQTAYANCAWDALGIAAALDVDATIATHDPLTRDPLTVRVIGGRVEPAGYLVHFGVPAAEWWADIGFT